MIDFSCKHDVYIRHHDGSILPMDVPHYEAKLVAPGTWQIMSCGDYHYLIAGDGEAVAVDTGYGAGDLRAYLENLAGMPVRWVINTHCHFDHTANNGYFDKVFCGAEEADRLTVPFPSFAGIEFPKNENVQVVGDGDVIPLRGRELEIFRIGDHSEGSIAILDRKERILFSGDEFIPGLKRIGNTVEKLERDMAKLLEHSDEFDRLCGGPEMFDAEEVRIYHEAAMKILAGEKSEGVQTHGEPPFGQQETYEGHTLYDWKFPRREDMNGGKGLPKRADDTEEFLYKGRKFVYKKDKIRD